MCVLYVHVFLFSITILTYVVHKINIINIDYMIILYAKTVRNLAGVYASWIYAFWFYFITTHSSGFPVEKVSWGWNLTFPWVLSMYIMLGCSMEEVNYDHVIVIFVCSACYVFSSFLCMLSMYMYSIIFNKLFLLLYYYLTDKLYCLVYRYQAISWFCLAPLFLNKHIIALIHN